MDIDTAFAKYFEYRTEVTKLEREIKRRRRPDATLQRVLIRQNAQKAHAAAVLKELGFEVETKTWTGKGECPPQAAEV
jgi:hypothetical protein